ncbi:MAG: hypothetical protein GY719_26795 [bacterium]|nr:hypothetical protein [bacterium]
MKHRFPKQKVLRVARPVVEFEKLIAAVRHEGGKVGWLELSSAPPTPAPESLEAAASRGVLRAVAVGGGRGVVVKPIRGEPVPRDLLREHFSGCMLVLVTGEIDAPRLEPSGEDWTVDTGMEPAKRWTTGRLVAELRKPRPWR